MILAEQTPFEKMELLKQEIQLLTVRIRRMLKRISDLKEENNLDDILRVEEALTRVQEKRQKTIDSLHRYEIDQQKVELDAMKLELNVMRQGGQDEDVEDDGFMEALKADVGDVWNDD